MLFNVSETSTTLPRTLPLYFSMYFARSASPFLILVDEGMGANTGSPFTGPFVLADQASGHAASSAAASSRAKTSQETSYGRRVPTFPDGHFRDRIPGGA